MTRVIIYRLGSLGDTIAALPCFHLIERAFPDYERLVLTNVPVSGSAPPLESILGDGGFVHGSIAYPRGLRDPVALARLAAKLRRQSADTLIYLSAARTVTETWRDVAYFKTCGFRRIIGTPIRRELNRNRIGPDGFLERESHRLGRTLSALGTIDFADRAWWDLRLSDPERTRSRAALGGLAAKPFVAVNAGGKTQEKDWGQSNWSVLLGMLGRCFAGHGLVVVGSQEDSERAQRFVEDWVGGSALDLCGRLNPRESAAALSRAVVFVGHDSGPMHLADAVGTPCVGLFGNYNRPRMWHPCGATTKVIHRLDGLASITPTEVAAAALGVAGQAAGAAP